MPVKDRVQLTPGPSNSSRLKVTSRELQPGERSTEPIIPVPVRLRLKIITCNFQRSFLSCKGIILMSAQPLMVQVMAAYVSLRLRMNFPHLFIVVTVKDKAVRVAPF